jgi:glycerol kinase
MKVEHEAEEIFENSIDCITEAMKQANLDWIDIASIGIANQRERERYRDDGGVG